MNLEAIEPALGTLVATVTGVADTCVRWKNAPAVRDNGRLVNLSWVSIVGVGVDETTWTYAENEDPLQELTPTVAGQRRATLQVWAQVLDQRPGQTARQVLELARTRMQAPSSLAALAAVGLALASVEPVVTLDARVDGRVISRASMDVHLNAVSEITDEAGRTSYIATATFAATITRPDGTAVDPHAISGGPLP